MAKVKIYCRSCSDLCGVPIEMLNQDINAGEFWMCKLKCPLHHRYWYQLGHLHVTNTESYMGLVGYWGGDWLLWYLLSW